MGFLDVYLNSFMVLELSIATTEPEEMICLVSSSLSVNFTATGAAALDSAAASAPPNFFSLASRFANSSYIVV